MCFVILHILVSLPFWCLYQIKGSTFVLQFGTDCDMFDCVTLLPIRFMSISVCQFKGSLPQPGVSCVYRVEQFIKITFSAVRSIVSQLITCTDNASGNELVWELTKEPNKAHIGPGNELQVGNV